MLIDSRRLRRLSEGPKTVRAPFLYVDHTNHSCVAVRHGLQLLAEEPDRDLIIRDGKLPLRKGRRVRQNLNPTGIEATFKRGTRRSERRLGDTVVSGDAAEDKCNNRAVSSSELVGHELEDSARSGGGSADVDHHGLVLSRNDGGGGQGSDNGSEAHYGFGFA